MALVSDLDRERVSDEAAAWLIRLQEEPDAPAVRAGFEAWHAASPAHQSAWIEVSETFDLIGQAMPAEESPAISVQQAKPVFTRRTFAVAATSVVAACVALIFLPGVMLRLGADHATSTGEWRELRLSDGSIVDLAPQSAIDVKIAAAGREVHLLEGQAFFRVTPDAARPFEVKAGDVRATVLGTEFDVRLEANSAAVAVSEGRVRVDFGRAATRASKILQANDWVQVTDAGQATVGTAHNGEIGAWRQGQLVAHDRPIAEIVDALRRYYGGVIVIANGATAQRRVTGVYELNRPLDALQALGRAHNDIAVTRVSPWLVVLSGG